jgi:hypothetical protein
MPDNAIPSTHDGHQSETFMPGQPSPDMPRTAKRPWHTPELEVVDYTQTGFGTTGSGADMTIYS